MWTCARMCVPVSSSQLRYRGSRAQRCAYRARTLLRRFALYGRLVSVRVREELRVRGKVMMSGYTAQISALATPRHTDPAGDVRSDAPARCGGARRDCGRRVECAAGTGVRRLQVVSCAGIGSSWAVAHSSRPVVGRSVPSTRQGRRATAFVLSSSSCAVHACVFSAAER